MRSRVIKKQLQDSNFPSHSCHPQALQQTVRRHHRDCGEGSWGFSCTRGCLHHWICDGVLRPQMLIVKRPADLRKVILETPQNVIVLLIKNM